jgi:hypothetical protein
MRLACASFKKAGAACHQERTMNDIFKGLLFLHGYRLPFESIEGSDGAEAGEKYASGFGNHAASQRKFAPLGHVRRQRGDEVRSPAQEVCVAGGCG